jgi:hypothetical protein
MPQNVRHRLTKLGGGGMTPKWSRLTLGDIARRITGFSTPIFGVSWTPPAAEHDAVRVFLTFLEDRRVLFNPYQLEVEWQVMESIQKLREQCNQTIAALPDRSPALAPLRGIRAACRKFLDEPHSDFPHMGFHMRRGSPDGPGFFTALGEFRATVGVHVGNLAVTYQIELEPELASILPPEDMDARKNRKR